MLAAQEPPMQNPDCQPVINVSMSAAQEPPMQNLPDGDQDSFQTVSRKRSKGKKKVQPLYSEVLRETRAAPSAALSFTKLGDVLPQDTPEQHVTKTLNGLRSMEAGPIPKFKTGKVARPIPQDYKRLTIGNITNVRPSHLRHILKDAGGLTAAIQRHKLLGPSLLAKYLCH